jgi:DNA sulfur modification protein DndB
VEALASGAEGNRVGLLHIPMSARFITNDGQHRRAAIEMALRDCPEVGDETIAVVVFLDIGLQRCQQMFADLNRYAIRPSRSIGVLYDHRDDTAELARVVVLSLPVFRDVVEMERSTLSMRSRKMFTLSDIYSATSALVSGFDGATQFEEKRKLASEFWEEVAKLFPEWQLVRERKITAGEVRTEYIHSHGIVLQALGKAGNSLLREANGQWKHVLGPSRSWTGPGPTPTMGGTRNARRPGPESRANVTLTTNLIKRYLKLRLFPEEQRVEEAFMRGRNGK